MTPPDKVPLSAEQAALRIGSSPRRIASNTLWLLSDRVLRLVLGALIWVWLARYLGPTDFGMYNYATAFAGLFAVIAALGLDGVVVRDIVRDAPSRDQILGTAFTLKLLGGCAALGLAIALVTLLRPDDAVARWLVGILAGALILQSFGVIDLWFQSQTMAKYSVYARGTAFITISVVIVALILNHAPLIAFAWAALAEVSLAAVGLVAIYILKGYSVVAWRTSHLWAKKLMRDSWPLVLSGLAIMVYMRIDQIMIGEMIGSEAVGIYSAATRLSEVWYFIPMAVASSVFPSILRSKEATDTLYNERFQRLYDLMVWLALAITIPITMVAYALVDLLYGKQYSEATTVLVIHVWAAVFVFLGVAAGKWYVAENLSIVLFQRTLAGSILNVIMNFILIPRYGVNGAALATLFSQAWAAYLHDFLDVRTRQTFYMKSKALFLVSTFKKLRDAKSHI